MADELEEYAKRNGIDLPKVTSLMAAKPKSRLEAERVAIERGAKELGVDPIDYATAISYETGGTFSPTQPGPRTKWGQHRGTIQYGEPQWKEYGVKPDFEDQVTRSNVEYLRKAGVKPGDTFDRIYAAINGGSASKKLSTQDWNTGRTIADNIRNAQRDHRGKVIERYGWKEGVNLTPEESTYFENLYDQYVKNPVIEKGVVEPKTAPAPTMPKPVAPIGSKPFSDTGITPVSPAPTPVSDQLKQSVRGRLGQIATPGIAEMPADAPTLPPVAESAEPVIGPEQPSARQRLAGSRNNIPQNRQPQTVTDVSVGEDEGFDATVNPSEGDNALESIQEQAAAQLARYADVDMDAARQLVRRMNLQGMSGGKYDPTTRLDFLNAEGLKEKGRQIRINFKPEDIQAVRAINEDVLKEKRRKATQEATANSLASQFEQEGELPSIAQLRALKEVGVKDADGVPIDQAIENERAAFQRSEDALGTTTNVTGGSAAEPFYNVNVTSEKRRFTPEQIRDILTKDKSFVRYEKEQARIAEQYKTRPLAAPIEFAKGIASTIPKAASAILKVSDIVGEINPTSAQNIAGHFSGKEFKADEGEAFKIGKQIDTALEGLQNKDLKDYYQAGDSIGQVGIQIGLGALTGGVAVPLLYGSSLGASSQYEEAAKAGKYTRQGAAILGGLTAISDALPVAWALRPLQKGAVGKILDGFLNSAFRSAVKEVGEKEAQSFVRELFKRTVDRAKTVATGSALEAGQELFADKKINDLYASLTYDPKRKVFEINNNDLETAFFAAIGGAGGGAARIAIENKVAQSEGVSRLIATDKRGNEFDVVEDRGKQVLVKDAKGKISVRNKDRLTVKPLNEEKIQTQPSSVEQATLAEDQPAQDTPAVQGQVEVEENLREPERERPTRRVTDFSRPEAKAMVVEPPKNIETVQAGKNRIAELEEQRDQAIREADTQPLSGLPNKRAFDRALPSAESDPNTSVVFLDLDNFKAYNDAKGQKAGDALLKKVADALNQARDEAGVLRENFHFGGDEFAALPPSKDAQKILDRAQEIFGQVRVGDKIVSLTGGIGQTFREAEVAGKANKKARKIELAKAEGLTATDREGKALDARERFEKKKAEGNEADLTKQYNDLGDKLAKISRSLVFRDFIDRKDSPYRDYLAETVPDWFPPEIKEHNRLYKERAAIAEQLNAITDKKKGEAVETKKEPAAEVLADYPDLAPKKSAKQRLAEKAEPTLREGIAENIVENASSRKAKAWKMVKKLRAQIKNEPLRGNKARLRLELIKWEGVWKEALRDAQSPSPARETEKKAEAKGQTFPDFVTERVGGNWYVSDRPLAKAEKAGEKRIKNSDYKRLEAEFKSMTSPQAAQDEPLKMAAEDYDAAIREAVEGTLTNPVFVANTSPILTELGMPALPIVVTPRVLTKTFRGKHADKGITAENVIAMRSDINRPLAVLKSENEDAPAGSLLLVLPTETKDSEFLTVAVHPNQKLGRLEVNRIASIHARNLRRSFGSWNHRKLFRYLDKQQSRRLTTTYGSNFASVVQSISDSTPTLLTEGDFVNTDESLQMAADRTETDSVNSLPVQPRSEFKVKPPKRLYRGIMKSGEGAKTASLGRGLYSTRDKAWLKRNFKFDDVITLTPEEAYPRNPLVIREPSAFADWLLEESGFDNMREFGKTYPDPAEFVRSKGFDGVDAGQEVVRYFDPNEDSILKKAAEPGDKEYLSKLRSAHTEDLTANAESKFTDGNLELNEEAGELLRRLEGTGSFYGSTYTKDNLNKLAAEADKWVKTYTELGYSDRQLQGLTNLAENLKQFAATTDDYGIAYIFDEAIGHEKRHVLDLRALGGKQPKREVVDQIVKALGPDPVFRRKYGKQKLATQAFEIIAAIANNEQVYGWSEEQRDFALKTWADGILDLNPGLDIEKFAEIYENANLTTSDPRRSEAERDDQEDVRDREEPGEGEGNRTARADGDGTRTAEEPEQPDAGRPRNERERKVASFSRILGQEYFYDQQSHEDTEVRAAQLISDKGTQQAIHDALYGTPSAEGMRVVYWELERLAGALDNAIAEDNKAEVAAYSEAAADLSAKIVQRQVAGGQETEIAKMLVPLSPESALLTAQKMVEYAKGEGSTLTPDQTETVIRLAKELKDARADIAKQDKKVKTLEKKIDALKEERPTTKTARRLKQYRKRKPTLVKELQDLFPEASVFNGETYSLQMAAEMDRRDFLGKPKIVGKGDAATLIPTEIRSLVDVEKEPFLDGRYSVRFSPDGATVYDDRMTGVASIIASYNFGETLVVSPPYRRQGIGTELVYQWRKRFLAPAKATTRNKISQQIQERVRDRLVDEGVLYMAASGLTDQQYAKLVEYAGGEILENKPYKTLLSELDQFTGDRQLSKDVHAEAVDNLRSERGSMSDEAKEALKTRNEHYREADKILKPKGENQNVKKQIDKDFKKLNDQNVRELSRIAQRVWAKTGDPLMTLAVERLNSDPKTINDVVKDIQRANPEMSLADATKFAREARKMLTETKAEMAAERDQLRGILPEQRRELQAAKVAKQKATMKLNKFLANLADDSNAIKRFNNDMRAKFVSNWGTQAFNAIQSMTVTNPTEAMLDLFTTGLKSVGLNIGETPDINAKDVLLPFSYVFANNKQMAEFALSEFPDQFFQVHSGLLGDIDIEPVNLAENKKNVVSKNIHKWFDLNQRVNNKLAQITGAKLQEMHFRNAVVAGTFDQIVRRRSGGKETLQSAIENGTLKNYITEKDAQFAADKALRVTFASQIDDKIGKVMKRAYDTLDSYVPIFLNPVVYARFTYTATKVMVANPILFGMLDAQRVGGQGYTTRSVASGLLAWSGIAMAYGLMANFGGDDDDWYTLKFGDTYFDIRRTFPLSAYFYVAHLIRQTANGAPTPDGKELLEGFASLETDYFTYGAGMEFGGALIDKKKEWSDVGVSGARLAGNFFAGYLRFFKPMRDALAQFDEEENKLRFYNNSGQDKFVSEIAKSLPLVARSYNAEVQKDATGQDIMMPFPAGRIVGINVVHPSFIKPEQSPATKWAAKLFPFEGSGGEMSAEDRKAWQMRRTIKNAVRRGLSKEAIQGRLQEYRKEFGERSFGRLKDELEMSELAAKIKYSFGMTDDKDIRALRKVWRMSTEQEKVEIRKVLRGKKNRTPEFNREFGL